MRRAVGGAHLDPTAKERGCRVEGEWPGGPEGISREEREKAYSWEDRQEKGFDS